MRLPAGHGCYIIMCENGILVTWQPKWSHDLQHSTLALTGLDGYLERPDLINHLVMSSSGICIFHNALVAKKHQTLFYLKYLWKQRQRFSHIKKTLSVLSTIQNCIWWWGSSPGNWRMWSNPSLPLFSGLLWPSVVVLIWAPSIGQIESFTHSISIIILVIWNYWNVCNLFELDKTTW